MKILGIYVSEIDRNIGPMFKEPVYSKAYPQLLRLLKDNNAQTVLIERQQDTYLGHGRFSSYWLPEFDETGEVLGYVFHEEEIQIDLVFDKARFEADDVRCINSTFVRDICRDKYLSYVFAPEIHPPTFLLENTKQLQACALGQADRDIVIKSLDSNSGKEVFIGKANDYAEEFEYPIIMQEYIESEAGIPGIVDGRHDIRVFIFDGEIIGCWLRTPPEGGKKANLSYNGINQAFKRELLPQELVPVVEELDKRFATTEHRYYSADFLYNGSKWYLLEFNAWPGLLDINAGDEERDVMARLAQKLSATLHQQVIMAA